MTPNKPYLVRALWEWISDNGMTPYLMIDASYPNIEVPEKFIDDGRIVFNVSDSAVRALDMGNEYISFSARFGGVAMDLVLPVAAVLGIYAKENGQGMLFPAEEAPPSPPSEPKPPEPGKPRRPALKIVK